MSLVDSWWAPYRRNPRAPARPKPGGASSWYSIFADRGVPRAGERGHAPDPLHPVLTEADRIVARAVQLWRDPEIGPWIGQLLDGDADEGPHDFVASDIPELLELNVTTDDALALMSIVQESLVETDRAVPPGLVRGIARDALADEAMRQRSREYESKPRLVNVPKDEAVAFIRRHHSALSEPNTRGLLYAIGVRLGGHLVAVATATTPSGRYAHPDSVLELSRIASDGSTKGASSMLAARILDLLPDSGRFGATGRLFVTYSLMHEPGTTYLALVDKGLRPTGVIAGKRQGGARKGPSTGLPQVAKVVWEAGPDAAPANWSVLADRVPAERLAGAARAFAKWEERQKR